MTFIFSNVNKLIFSGLQMIEKSLFKVKTFYFPRYFVANLHTLNFMSTTLSKTFKKANLSILKGLTFLKII